MEVRELANTITVARLPLLALIIVLLYQPASGPRFIAAGLTVLLIVMDTLDGVVARALKQESLIGSVLDIAADRTVELLLWVVYADLDLIPVAIPLVVIARGVFVDALRSVAPARGLTPFGLMRSRLGKFLVKSPWLRTPYGIAKAAAFCLLATQHGLAATTGSRVTPVTVAAQAAAWLAVLFCVTRALPVLVEGPRSLMEGTGSTAASDVAG